MVLKKDGIRFLGLPVMLLAVAGVLTSCTTFPIPQIPFEFQLGGATLRVNGGGSENVQTITATVPLCGLPSLAELQEDALAAAVSQIPGITEIDIRGVRIRGLDLLVDPDVGVGDASAITAVAITFIAQDGTRIELGSATSASGFGDTISLDTGNIDFFALISDIDPDATCPPSSSAAQGY